MDVVMGIVSDRNVFITVITRYGKSLCYGLLLYSYNGALFIFLLLQRGTFHILYHKFAVLCHYSQDNGDSVAIVALV